MINQSINQLIKQRRTKGHLHGALQFYPAYSCTPWREDLRHPLRFRSGSCVERIIIVFIMFELFLLITY